MTGNRAEAQDAAQEAYVRAWQRWSTVSGYDNPEAWVRTVALIAALRQLSEAERQAVTMHHLMDLPVAEVAVQTGVPVNTVKTRLARGAGGRPGRRR
jgi:RNA polymerase sigma-70 factor (ECF subfamily)